MNLLGLLMAAMTTKNALAQVSKKTGLSEKQIKKLVMIAVPILIKYLTKNASSGDGAHSLLGALAQHNNKEDIGLQLKDADEKDGHKIISHIFGKKEEAVTQNLSAQSGLTQEQVPRFPVFSVLFWDQVPRSRQTRRTTRSTARLSFRLF